MDALLSSFPHLRSLVFLQDMFDVLTEHEKQQILAAFPFTIRRLDASGGGIKFYPK